MCCDDDNDANSDGGVDGNGDSDHEGCDIDIIKIMVIMMDHNNDG